MKRPLAFGAGFYVISHLLPLGASPCARPCLSASEVMTLRNPTRLGSLELKVSDWRRRAASPSKTYIGRSVSTTLMRSARRRTTKPRPFFECLLAWQRPLPNAAGLLVRRNEDDRWQDGLRHCWQTH